MDEETRKRIEEGLLDWHNPHSETRRRFEDARQKWDERLQHLADAIIASEHLTEKDFFFRVGPCEN